MLDIPSFFMRWFFLSNLIRDVAEIQLLPYTPYTAHYHHPQPQQQQQHYSQCEEQLQQVSHNYPSNQQPQQQYYNQQSQTQEHQAQVHYSDQQQQQEQQQQIPASLHRVEEEWRDHCLRGILSYPPGTQRLLVMDAMRVELVQQLEHALRQSDTALRRLQAARERKRQIEPDDSPSASHGGGQIVGASENASSDSETTEDSYLDTDVEIVKTFECGIHYEGEQEDEELAVATNGSAVKKQKAVLVVSRNGTEYFDSETAMSNDNHLLQLPHPHEIEEHRRRLKEFREYLPQLVSAVLKSPPAYDPNLVNPVQKMRELILTRCQEDPSWGIELCWLLEAEVGRAWKNLFEHRQETGKRLIVVLPAEKAAVLAKIGTEKREAFDLLQDAERVTAYGYSTAEEALEIKSALYNPSQNSARLPSSLSVRRCSHFGDTMHFIDRLTKISMDLRMVPAIQRHEYLHEALYELNRRLRRRMVTRGEVSIDFEDNRGAFDWPEITDLTTDMLQYSVHFPLLPSGAIWPSGTSLTGTEEKGGVVHVLNIVVPESRVLASRERCPYLVRLEVVETGLEGEDPRLYASGSSRLGMTVEEALGMKDVAKSVKSPHGEYEVPRQIVDVSRQSADHTHSTAAGVSSTGTVEPFPRGGWHVEANGTDFVYSNPYDNVRQYEYEQLHRQMQGEPMAPPQQQVVTADRPPMTSGLELLNSIFGQPWLETCDEIRRTSPFGHVNGWRLASFIVKAGEDIRQEALVMQIIMKLRNWFETELPESHRPHLRPYTIMCVGGDAGLVECLTDAKSVDEVKKKTDGFVSLRDYFERAYGSPGQSMHAQQGAFGPGTSPQHRQPQFAGLSFEQAQDNFLRSLVGYSLVCYILQIKDRHNANILMDREGHIMHIDFGFVLGDTPRMAKVPIFTERAPFKLSGEFWEVLGGWNVREGGLGVKFCKMFEHAFACASAHSDEIAGLVEGAMLTLSATASEARSTAARVRSRLRMRGAPGSNEQKMFIMDLINTALTSLGTSTYDWLQKNMNGYQ